MLSKKIVKSYKKDEELRLNKYLSDAGVCSRRQADKDIEAGRVLVDGKVATLGDKITLKSKIVYNGKLVQREEELILIALNKPVGIECTADLTNKDNIVSYVNYPKRIYPIGRLDKDSEGLILLTNEGTIVNKILKAVNNHEKEYVVKVNKPITDDFLKRMAKGVPILDTITRPCKLKKISENVFSITLTQGLNRQIRRMCKHFKYNVESLKRIRIMNIKLANLEYGKYRKISDKELKELLALDNSKDTKKEVSSYQEKNEIHETNYKKKANHEKANHEKANHEKANHEKANHEKANHKKTNHEKTNHEKTYSKDKNSKIKNNSKNNKTHLTSSDKKKTSDKKKPSDNFYTTMANNKNKKA